MDRNDVFISYRRADVEFAKKLYQKLKATNHAVWIDWENLPPGVEGFTDEIQRGIQGTDAFICVLSPSYLESEYCLMELREALKLKKRVIPLVVKKFDPLPAPEGIGHINWVYFTSHAGHRNRFDDSFPKVIQALEADYEHVREHTRLLLRAIDWQKNEKNKSYLLKDAEIGKAERWQVAAIGKNPPPTELQSEYILASRTYQRQYQRRLTAIFGILMVFAIFAAIFAGFQSNAAVLSRGIALVERNNALTQEARANAESTAAFIAKEEAVDSKILAQENEEIAKDEAQNALISGLAAQSQLTQNRQLGILLALQAYKQSEKKNEFNPAVETSLRATLVDFSGLPVHPYQSEGTFVQFSPNDRWLISMADGGHVKISDLDQGLDAEAVTLAEGDLYNIVVSPDSEWLAGIFTDYITFAQEIQVWELKKLEAGPQTLALPQDAAPVLTLAFSSHEGRRYWLAAGLEDGSIYRWNVADLPGSTAVLFNNKDKFERSLSAMAFSPDGTWLAAAFASSDGDRSSLGPILALWNLANRADESQTIDLIQIPVVYLEFSHSGKWLAGGSSDGTKLRLWNMNIASTLPSAQTLNVDGINDIDFSPDERWMAIAEASKARVFNLRNFSGFVLPGYKDVVLTVGFSPNGRLLATGDYDGRINLWNTADFSDLPLAESQPRIYNGFDVIVQSLDFNSDGSRLAAAGDEQVRVWNFPETISAPVRASTTFSTQNLENTVIVQTAENRLFVMDLSGEEPVTIIQTELKFPISYWPSPDERYLAVTNDKQIRIWDLQNPDSPLFDLERQQGKFVFPTFTEDSDWFVYAIEDQIFALDLEGQKSKNPIELVGNRHGSIVSEFFTVDHWLISRSTSEVLAWDTSTSLSAMTRLSRSSASSSVYFNSDNSTWIFVQQPGAVLAWDTENLATGPISVSGEYTGVFQNRWLFTHSENIQRLWDLSQPASPVAEFVYSGFSPSEKWLYYFDEEGPLHLLDLKSANPKPVTLGNFPNSYPLISSDDQWLAIVSDTGDPGVLYKLTAHMQKFELPSGYVVFSFSPDGKWLALTSLENYSVLLRELTDDSKDIKLPDHSAVIFSPDGHWLVLQDQLQRTALFDLQNRELVQKTYPPTYGVELSPDGRWLIGDLQENNRTNALLVDLHNPQKIFTLQGHTDQMIGKYFTPDERSLLTYGYDGTIRIWNLENPAGDPVVLHHDARVSEVDFSGNGRWLISKTPQGVYIWQWAIEDVRELACRLAGRNLTEDEWTKYMSAAPYEKTCSQWP